MSNTTPVSEVQIPSNMSVAFNFSGSFIRKKTCRNPNTAILQHDISMRSTACVALFVGSLRTELTEKLYSKVGSPIRYNKA